MRKRNMKVMRMNIEKALLGVMTLFCMVFTVGLVSDMSSVNTVCATSKSSKTNKKAMKSYKTFLSNTEYKKWKFAIHDINDDGVKELILDSNATNLAEQETRIYTYYKGKVKFLKSCMRQRITVYKNGMIGTQLCQSGGYEFMFYKLKKGKLKVVAGIKGVDLSLLEYLTEKELKNVQIEEKFYYWTYCKVNGKNAKIAKYRVWERNLYQTVKTVELRYRSNTRKNRTKYLK